ncbi:MAG: KpsF/GutQ family sugar-phosphate isomerase [Pseudomonadota bacterium]
MTIDPESDDLQTARDVLNTEITALQALRDKLDERFALAVETIVSAKGFVTVTGVGKSGHIGHKIAATFASTGTPSFFIHPTEASHGDLGMLRDGAIVIAISNSGETKELGDILTYCKRTGTKLIAMTARANSFLGTSADVALILPQSEEACPNRLAPTSSTTMTLALGDALAVAVMKRRGFTAEEFGARHPGGSLGMRLQLVKEWMHRQKEPPNPTISGDAPFFTVLKVIADGCCGAVSVLDKDGKLAGIITDGDVRRAVERFEQPRTLTAREMANGRPTTVKRNERMETVVEILQSQRISQIIVAEDNTPLALIHVKDLMQSGYI